MEGRILVRWQENNLCLRKASYANDYIYSQAIFVNLVKQTCLTKSVLMLLNDLTPNSLTYGLLLAWFSIGVGKHSIRVTGGGGGGGDSGCWAGSC